MERSGRIRTGVLQLHSRSCGIYDVFRSTNPTILDSETDENVSCLKGIIFTVGM